MHRLVNKTCTGFEWANGSYTVDGVESPFCLVLSDLPPRPEIAAASRNDTLGTEIESRSGQRSMSQMSSHKVNDSAEQLAALYSSKRDIAWVGSGNDVVVQGRQATILRINDV